MDGRAHLRHLPRLAERRNNGWGQLSGGEQEMLAISRALLQNRRLLVMDEPTEGLAPVIVEQVEALLARLAEEGDLEVLLIEQNIGVGCAIADRVAVLVNGRINRSVPAQNLRRMSSCSSACSGLDATATRRTQRPRPRTLPRCRPRPGRN